MILNPRLIPEAQTRLTGYIHRTPILRSSRLDALMGHHFVFKAEGFQKVGAFKARGAMNTLLRFQEIGRLPERVVAFSSGNHAQAVAWAASLLGVRATILIPKSASAIKIAASRAYGANVILTETRPESEARAALMVAEGAVLIPPYDHDDVICGQGTACLEALQDGVAPDAVFAPVGGGGLISGTWLAVQAAGSLAKVFGAEPVVANDAARSYREDRIIGFETAPVSLADGVQTLKVSERTFAHIRKLDGLYEISEDDIITWTQWLSHLLKVLIEPTSALGMAAAVQWLKGQASPRTALIILSGGNVSAETQGRVWAEDRLTQLPR